MSDISLSVDDTSYADAATITVLAGESLDFKCVVTGATPAADVSWEVGGVTFSGNTVTQTITATTTATCTALNVASLSTRGPVSKTVTIRVPGKKKSFERR